jgi:hypothetical protein
MKEQRSGITITFSFLRTDQDYLDDLLTYKDRFNIPTQIGGDQPAQNFFNTKIRTGNKYNELTVLMRQQYDLGKKDSLVTDSTVIPLFYPRLRFEHTIRYNSYKYRFLDYETDSVYYRDVYGITLPHPSRDTFELIDSWKILSNDFSIYQFPDAKNLQQFIRVGATVENIKGTFSNRNSVRNSAGGSTFYNIIFHGEYRNKTRNRKWDMELYGNLYTAGFNSGDYNAHITLKRFVGKKQLGYAEVGFENINRTPSFVFDNRSSFYLDTATTGGFNKENTTHIFASLYQPGLQLKITGDYFLISNYTYFTGYYRVRQHEPLFNLLRVSAQKIFNIGKRWRWYADVYLQQKSGAAPLKLPLLFTRHRFGYQGNLGFKNLDLFFGVEMRYHSPYSADGYSPLQGQFFYQDSVSIMNRPDISAFVHFRVRSFKAFLRFENLNTAEVKDEGFGWTRNNLAAPNYPYPGFQIKLGIWWSFVN